MPHALVLVEVGEGLTVRRPAHREGPRPFAVGYAVLPGDVPAASGEGGDEARELGMDGPAVVALVVVLRDDLPVGIDVVREAQPESEVRERIALDARRDRAELLEQRRARLLRDPEPATPGVDGEGRESEVGGIDVVRRVGCMNE